MSKRVALPRFIVGLGIAFALFMAVTLQAVQLSITATAGCDEISGGFVITYTAGVDPSYNVTNPSVNILFNGTVVDNGAFTTPSYSFSDTLPAPAGSGPGDTVTVALNVIGTWSNGTPASGAANVATTQVVLPADACAPGTGRFTGGGHQITVAGVKVTHGLTIHCDLLLSNNLEINWGGNQFHMTEHVTTVSCTDDPVIDQTPPAAPLDTLVGVGTGRYNGTDGYTIEFTLVDHGEPGSGDQMAIKVFETANPGNVALLVPLQNLTGGNLQAHYDQPHKK